MSFQSSSRRLLLPIVTIAVAVTVLTAFPNTKQTSGGYLSQNNPRKKSDEMVMPIVNYDDSVIDNELSASPELKSPEVRSLRNARYDNKVWVQDLEQRSQVLSTNHWWSGLSALPVVHSDAIVFGEVIGAQAYLSNDKSGVYSEFRIRVDEVLQAHKSVPLATGGIVVGERAGGAVRFQSGHVTQYFYLGQGFPRIGSQYVFFLKMNEFGQDFHILTGYRLGREKVQALDQKDIFAQYEGRDRDGFFSDLREAIARSRREEKSNEINSPF
jgi:hypothetical protein